MKMLLIIIVVILFICFVECVREICTFQVTHYKIHSDKLKNIHPKKIVLLSDLHNCSYGKNNEKLLQVIKRENPDMILIAGDMLVGKKGVSTEVARKFLKELPKICNTYYANGNHEQRMKNDPEKYGDTYREYNRFLKSQGVLYLENEKGIEKWDELEVEVLGLEIPDNAYGKFCKVSIPEDYVEQCFGKADDTKFQILIAHNPLFVKQYLNWGGDLIVSGHLHGGVVRIPFWRGIISPQGGLFPKYSGEMKKEGETTVIVSKGIGLHTIPVRLLNPTEVIVLHIGDSEE